MFNLSVISRSEYYAGTSACYMCAVVMGVVNEVCSSTKISKVSRVGVG